MDRLTLANVDINIIISKLKIIKVEWDDDRKVSTYDRKAFDSMMKRIPHDPALPAQLIDILKDLGYVLPYLSPRVNVVELDFSSYSPMIHLDD